MFCFITSLRSAKVAEDWTHVSRLFERMAASVFGQSASSFRLIAVCHEPPKLKQCFDERLEFITVNFPAPSYDCDQMFNDKVRKLIVALRRSRELGASYVMPIDADDLISSRLVAYALAHPDADGWFVDRGWRYGHGSRWIDVLDRFNLICGSCNILSRRWFAFPDQPEREREAETELIENGHHQVAQAFLARGVKLKPIPFRAAVYVDHFGDRLGEELSRRQAVGLAIRRRPVARIAGQLKRASLMLRKRRWCDADLRQEFAIGEVLKCE